MRYPFWKWTGWLGLLSVGLSGCLHGQDWRAAVSKPLTRPVADRRESVPTPKFVGPVRKERTPFVPPPFTPTPITINPQSTPAPKPIVTGPRPSPVKTAPTSIGHVTPSAITARPLSFTASDLNRTSPISTEAIQPPTTHDEAQPRGAKMLEAEFVPPPAPPAMIPATLTQSPPSASPMTGHDEPIVNTVQAVSPTLATSTTTQDGYAEFERSIPRRNPSKSQPREPVPQSDDREITVVPMPEPTAPPSMPIIVPAGRTAPVSAVEVPQSFPTESEKEWPDVSDIITTEPDSPDAETEQVARPRDVAVLVEQVFEDLRQRRLDQARQRTAWLKQIVTKREIALEKSASTKRGNRTAEPKRLNLDSSAIPVDQSPSHKLLDDESTFGRP